jgi:hypothetical protein
VANGFESKDVEFQQAEAERRLAVRREGARAEPAALDHRRALELSLARARAEFAHARSSAHQQMLTATIATLEHQLARMS